MGDTGHLRSVPQDWHCDVVGKVAAWGDDMPHGHWSVTPLLIQFPTTGLGKADGPAFGTLAPWGRPG